MFYVEGIGATGVDAVSARAGVSKPTLYAQFGSKRELVSAVLTRRHERQRAELQAHLAATGGPPVARLLSVFDWLAGWHAGAGGRGCGFLNAAAETPDANDPARRVIAAHKQWFRDVLCELAREAGLDDPEEVGYGLLLLVDGANARVLVDGERDAAARAGRIARTLVEAHRPGQGRRG